MRTTWPSTRCSTTAAGRAPCSSSAWSEHRVPPVVVSAAAVDRPARPARTPGAHAVPACRARMPGACRGTSS
ncbi:hypothetical protein ACR6C2_32695 [Streptomyces sp. INA 01156]